MAPADEHTAKLELEQAEFHTLLREKMRTAIRLTLTVVLEEELRQVVGAGRYERSGVLGVKGRKCTLSTVSSKSDHVDSQHNLSDNQLYVANRDLIAPRTSP